MKAIKVTIYRWTRSERCWTPKESHRCASARRAERWALERIPARNVSRSMPRGDGDFAEIIPRRAGKRVTRISQPVRYVPSVADVGYW